MFIILLFSDLKFLATMNARQFLFVRFTVDKTLSLNILFSILKFSDFCIHLTFSLLLVFSNMVLELSVLLKRKHHTRFLNGNLLIERYKLHIQRNLLDITRRQWFSLSFLFNLQVCIFLAKSMNNLVFPFTIQYNLDCFEENIFLSLHI